MLLRRCTHLTNARPSGHLVRCGSRKRRRNACPLSGAELVVRVNAANMHAPLPDRAPLMEAIIRKGMLRYQHQRLKNLAGSKLWRSVICDIGTELKMMVLNWLAFPGARNV